MTPQQQLVRFARDRMGPRGVVDDPDLLAPWLVDWRGRWRGAAAAMLQPASVDELAPVVAEAARLGVALVPQGGNSSMVGGATPDASGAAVLLSLRRMDRIRHLDADAGQLVAEAGVVLHAVHEAALAQGRRFPLTLGARGTATVGGLVSTNAGGTQVLRFGTMRRLTLGVEAVLADGSVHQGLSGLAKDNRGYDLSGLLVGAEGTLGIVTAAALRLVPTIAGRGVAWVGVASPADALRLLRRLEAAIDGIESFELMPEATAMLGAAHLGTSLPLARGRPWHCLIEATVPLGRDPADASDLLATALAAAVAADLVADAVVAQNEGQAEGFWAIRDTLSAAARAAGPAVQFDIAVPVGDMPAFLEAASQAAQRRFPGTEASGFGHLGDGNVHFHVRAPGGVDPQRWYGEEAPVITRFVHDLVAAEGGTISAEHGIGQMKVAELERLGPPARLAAMRAIKRALDPHGILNPGKLVRLDPGAAGQ